MTFRALADEISEDFGVAGQGREFFPTGFQFRRAGALAKTSTAPAPSLPRSVPIPDPPAPTLDAKLLDELAGTTWGAEASLEAQRRRRR